MTRRVLLLAGTALVLVGGATGAFLWQQQRAQAAALALACTPARPDVAGWPAELRERIAALDARLRRGEAAPDALAELSRLYHANGFYAEAALCYQGLAQLQPREPRWPHRLAVILAGYGRLADAVPLWETTVRLAPENVVARIRLGDALLKANRPADAAAHYRAALAAAPDHPYALLGLARVAMAAGRWQEARNHLESAAGRTGDAVGADLLATAYEQLGEQGRALALRGKQKASGAFSDIPDPWIDELLDECFDTYRLSVASGAAAHGGDLAGAAIILERALRLSPDSVPTIFQRGGLRLRQQDLAGSRKDFQRCTELQPEFSDGWAYYASVLKQQGLAAESDRALAAGLARCPNSPGLRLDFGRRLAAAGQHERAVAEFRTSLRLRPEEAEAYVDLAQSLFTLERVNEGVATLLEAQRVEPDNPSVLSILAFSAINLGDEPAARKWMQRIRQQPRVAADSRAALAGAFRDRFGRAPD